MSEDDEVLAPRRAQESLIGVRSRRKGWVIASSGQCNFSRRPEGYQVNPHRRITNLML